MSGDLPLHLGGGERRCHNDLGALKWAMEKWNIKSLLDIGCGKGCVVMDGIKNGLTCLGVDGDPGDLHESEWKFTRPKEMPFLLHDYTVGPAPIEQEFDLCWSVEFLEHVEEKYIPNYIESFKMCKYVIATHAPPKPSTVNGKSATNHHHVNEQYADYWIDVFEHYGFNYDEVLTRDLRLKSTMKKDFIRNNGLVFIRD